jgi:hypothetical protein
MLFDRKRCLEVVRTLLEAYKNKSHIFRYIHKEDVPQDKQLPDSIEKKSLEHILLLFFNTLITYRNQSQQGMKQAVDLLQTNPEFFTSEIIRVPESYVRRALKKVGFIYHQEAGRRWKLSGTSLFENFNGNPTNIFKAGSINAVLDMKKQLGILSGYGPKLLSLLALLYEDLGLIPHIKGAFPVDVHIQAQCISTKIISFNGAKAIRAEKVAEFLRNNVTESLYEKDMSPFETSYAAWLLGSNHCWICNKERAKNEFLCPIKKFCCGRINTNLYRNYGIWYLAKPVYPLFDGKYPPTVKEIKNEMG